MTTVAHVADFLEAFAPKASAAEWDNVGLLLGDAARAVAKLMTCLTITPAVVDEAVAEHVDLVVAHHPLPFRPLKTITTAHFDGRRLWSLASAGISVYSPHTGFDSAPRGINRRLAELLGLSEIVPLAPIAGVSDPQIGIGRRGRSAKAVPLDDFARQVKRLLKTTDVAVVGAADRSVQSIAVGCGSAGDLLKYAVAQNCDCFLTGETNFHTALEAEAAETALVLVGHYASERFAVELLADELRQAFPTLTVWASRRESDPLRRV